MNKIFKKNCFYDYGYPSSFETKAKLIKEAGFDGVFLDTNNDLEKIAKIYQNEGLDIETVHLPFNNVCNLIWLEGQGGEDYINDLISWIKRTKKIGCDKVIFHVAQSTTPPQTSEIGFTRFARLVKACEEEKVYLAVENLRAVDYMDECLKRVKSSYLCCCFDCGHANCFTKNIEVYDFQKYKGLITCLHLHDNDGLHDQHFPLFKGNINFKKLMKNLKKIGYENPLTLELFNITYENDEKVSIKNAYNSLVQLEKYYNE